MEDLIIRPLESGDIPAVIGIWNACAQAGEVLYPPLEEAYFQRKFLLGEGCERDNLLVAEGKGQVRGFIHGVAPETFRLGKPGRAYLTCLMVEKSVRGQGIGRALLEALIGRMRTRNAQTLDIASLNPVNLDWRVPGTPGHDHNNMPGLDMGCAGQGFFPHAGFQELYREVALYQDLSHYRLPPEIGEIRARLASQGIETGVLPAPWDQEFDGMCDRVGSDYWRDVLRTETAAWREGAPNRDGRFWPDGVRPAGPRPILAAVHEGHIVGFTGPVDLQKSGRGWFTGICTDPLYERRGVATVLFNLLMEAFVQEGARFTTLFTGADSHARKVYQRAGLRPVREFALMRLGLNEGGEA